MSLTSFFSGRIAYMRHIEGNQLSDKGQVQQADAKYQEAFKAYEKCVADKNCKHAYLEAYSVLLMRYSRFDEAMALLRRADKLPMAKQDKLKLRINYAVCQWKTGRLDQAIELLESVYNDLKTSIVYGSLGFLYIARGKLTGDFSQAIAFNIEAYEYDEDDPVVLDNMGQLYLAMGQQEKAQGYFENAHALKPRQVDTLYYLALIYHNIGRNAEAKELLSSALEGNYSALATTTREMAKELFEQISG